MKLRKGFSVVPVQGLIVGRLYSTNIVLIDTTTNTITLNTGSWFTKHTKNCMNDILSKYGFKVFQKSKQWYIAGPDNFKAEYKDGWKLDLNQFNLEA